MKSYLPVVLILFSSLVYTSGVLVMIRNSNAVAQYYFDEIQRSGSGSTSGGGVNNFTTLDNESRKQLCDRSLSAVQFVSLIRNSRQYWIHDNIGEEIETRMQLVANFYANAGIDVHNVSEDILVDFVNNDRKNKSTNMKVAGIPCISEDTLVWSIADGSDYNHFYIIGHDTGKQAAKRGKFLGLVEEVSTEIDHQYANGNEDVLLQALQQSISAYNDAQYKKNIHNMDDFNASRACISAYTAMEANNLDRNRRNFSHERQHNMWCVHPSISSQIIVISCSINNAAFYLTADQTESGAAFYLIQEGGVCKVTSRLKNVLALDTL